MNLREIVNLMKEISECCTKLEGNDFYIGPSKLQHSNVDGYQIHITGKFDDDTRKCLNEIAIKNRLSITMEQYSVMIYSKKPLDWEKL